MSRNVSTPEYSACILEEMPPNRNVDIYYPAASSAGGRDGILVEVQLPKGDSWIGCFAFGHGVVTDILPVPSSHKVCVVSKGAGYVVDTREPSSVQVLKPTPVTAIAPTPNHELLIVLSFGDIGAMAGDGWRWQHRLAGADALEIEQLTADSVNVRGRAFGREFEANVIFASGELRTNNYE
jgi:hypothetical protein